MQIAPPAFVDFDRMFGALADHTRRDIVRRAITADEGVVELASHYPMSFAAVQKHIAILERAGLVIKERVGRRKIVRTNLEPRIGSSIRSRPDDAGILTAQPRSRSRPMRWVSPASERS